MQIGFRLTLVVVVATGIVLSYLACILLAARLELILALYCVSVGAMVWMTVRILKDPYSTDKSFDDYFYQDRPDLHRIGKD